MNVLSMNWKLNAIPVLININFLFHTAQSKESGLSWKTNNIFTTHKICILYFASKYTAQSQEPHLCTWRSSLSSHDHQCKWCQGWKVESHQHQAAVEPPWRTSQASHCCGNPWCNCLAFHTGYYCVTRVALPWRGLWGKKNVSCNELVGHLESKSCETRERCATCERCSSVTENAIKTAKMLRWDFSILSTKYWFMKMSAAFERAVLCRYIKL